MAAASCCCLAPVVSPNVCTKSSNTSLRTSAMRAGTLPTFAWNSEFFPKFSSSSLLGFGKQRFSSDRHRRLGLEIRAISSNEFRTGTSIEMDGAPWRVQEFLHVKPGKGAAFVRTKLRNYITGNTVEKTFRAGESVDEAVVVKDVKQYTYADGDEFVFMDMSTYEETRMQAKDLGDKMKFLKEGMDCNVLTWRDKVIDIELPVTLRAKVVQTDPGVKGDTAGGGGSKPATIETGATVSVPLFVNEGDEILVDTRTGTYMSRG
eukprot:TRINITY_DN593_c0_g1_i2.p1 TRINITY_DN593_c0_g1~~TRINITY_DN593_c0_g1_i2.p1  ORF type:complete len:273 (-),score=76.99 TRINITY_DN593_c0_g1_i2:235-1020(-)